VWQAPIHAVTTRQAGGRTPTGDQQERLGLDYSQTAGLLHDLTNVRFKLLAFVPSITGAAVAPLSHNPSAAELLAVGVLGLVATTGALICERGWSHLIAWGYLHALHLHHAQQVALAIGALAGLLVLFEFLRIALLC